MNYLTFIEVLVNDLGISLCCYSDGTLALAPNYMFAPTYDHWKDGVSAVFDNEGFSLITKDAIEHLDYGTAYEYKTMPALKQWLVQQQLELN